MPFAIKTLVTRVPVRIELDPKQVVEHPLRLGLSMHVDVAIAAFPWGAYLGDEALEKGVDACVSSWSRLAPNTVPTGAKAGGNYLSSYLIGREAREQFQAKHGKLPDHVAACVGGGSNAMGIFTAFLGDASVKLVGVEPSGEGTDKPGRHAATLSMGKPGEIHGMKCYVLENADGTPAAVHSIASGLDYPGVGPQHSYLKDLGRVQYESVTDKECLDAFMQLSRVEGIIPALESAHAVAWAMRVAPGLPKDQDILINLSGRGDKDADYVAKVLGL